MNGEMVHHHELLVSDSFIKVKADGGKVTGVELLNTGT